MKNSNLRIGLVILWCFFIVHTVPSHAKRWEYTQLSSNTRDDRHPRISKDQVVWNGYNSSGRSCILLYDLVTKKAQDISSGKVSGHLGMPAIHNAQVAFRAYDRISTHHYYVWKNGGITEIFSSEAGSFPPYWGYPPSYESIEPNIFNGRVVFTAWDGHDYEIMIWDDSHVSQVTDNDTNDYEPQVYDGWVSFTGITGSDYFREDVFLWDGVGIWNISNHRGKDEDSNVWKNSIVWTGIAYDYNDPYFDIYINDHMGTRHVFFLAGNDFEPVVNDAFVAWTNKTTSGPYKVMVWDGYKVFQLGDSRFDALEPQISEDKVVFNAWDGSDYEIYVATYTQGKFRSPRWQGGMRGVVVSAGLAYIAHGTGGLKILDVTDPKGISEVSSLSLGSETYDILKKNDHIFLASREGGVSVIDVTDPHDPFIKQIIDTRGLASNLCLVDEYLYVGDREGDLAVIDIRDPSHAVLRGTLNLPGTSYGCAIYGSYAYVANYYAGYSVLDIQDPGNPRFVKNIRCLGNVYDMAVSEDRLYYVALSTQPRFVSVDISDPDDPREVGSCALPVGSDNGFIPYDLKVRGDMVFLGYGTQGVLAVDVHDPSRPSIGERIDTTGFSCGIFVDQDYLYATDYGDGIKVFDVSDYPRE